MLFQEKFYRYTSGRRLTIHDWYRQSFNFGSLTIFRCVKNSHNCSAFNTDVGHSSRSKFINQAVTKEQPANIKDNMCGGAIFSSDFKHLAWVAIPCNISFRALFVCEKLSDKTYDIHHFVNNISTSFHLRVDRSLKKKFVLEHPSVNCLYPWLAGDHTCVILLETKLPDILSIRLLSSHCQSINATLFEMSKVYPELGIYVTVVTAEGSTFETLKALHQMYNEHKGFIMGQEPNNCAEYNSNTRRIYWGNCSLLDTEYLTDPFLIACIRKFDSSALLYDMMSVFICEEGNVIAEAFQCDGIEQCMLGEDEHNCNITISTTTDCSPFSLSAHNNAECLNRCPVLFVPCANGQCIPLDAICNNYKDCEDGWDEIVCATAHQSVHLNQQINTFQGKVTLDEFRCADGTLFESSNLCIFDIDKHGALLTCGDGSHLVNCEYFGCPQAFKCSHSFCIPLRRLCDNVIDCPDEDDEASCDNFICRGLLQCRQSNICVPPWEVCDGIVHCVPFQEDEIYCAKCPPGMRCKGNAALCDIDQPQQQLHIIDDLQLLALTSLTCRNHSFSYVKMFFNPKDLVILDVQMNQVSNEQMISILLVMPRLSYLNAGFNLINSVSNANHQNHAMKILNLSFNRIRILKSFAFKAYPNLNMLLLQHNQIDVIEVNSFLHLKVLMAIDMSNNMLILVSVADLPSYSQLLREVKTDLLYICCLLPHVANCKPQADQFSSCHNLLHSAHHKILITGQAIVTLITNSAVIILNKHLNKREHSPMLHLTAANLIMSLYLSFIAMSDVIYKDNFLHIAVYWRHFYICKIAASFSLIGYEVSFCLILYISMIRAYCITFMLTHISTNLTWIVFSSIWIFWTIYTFAVLLLMNFIDIPFESNICIFVFFYPMKQMLLIIHMIFFVSFNMINLVLLFICYGVISWNSLSNKSNLTNRHQLKKRKVSLLTHIIIILFFITCCLLPLILSSLLSLLGYHLVEAVPVWMAILVIPINASFSPIMFCLFPVILKAIRNRKKSNRSNIVQLKMTK